MKLRAAISSPKPFMRLLSMCLLLQVLAAVLDDDALVVGSHLLAGEVIDGIVLLPHAYRLHLVDAGCSTCDDEFGDEGYKTLPEGS